MKHMEYEELMMPEEILVHQEKLAQLDPNNPENIPTMTKTGFIDWINKRGQDGWCVVWSQLRGPYVVFEREVTLEEVKK